MDTLVLQVIRKRAYPRSIGGDLYARGAFVCHTLELPWLWNVEAVSCVPNGHYTAIVRYDHVDRWRMELRGVPGRNYIQIHIGNYPKNSKGCVLVGTATTPDHVSGSAAAYAKLKAAFYGTSTPTSSPNQHISITFEGIMPRLRGDFVAGGGGAPA